MKQFLDLGCIVIAVETISSVCRMAEKDEIAVVLNGGGTFRVPFSQDAWDRCRMLAAISEQTK